MWKVYVVIPDPKHQNVLIGEHENEEDAVKQAESIASTNWPAYWKWNNGVPGQRQIVMNWYEQWAKLLVEDDTEEIE